MGFPIFLVSLKFYRYFVYKHVIERAGVVCLSINWKLEMFEGPIQFLVVLSFTPPRSRRLAGRGLTYLFPDSLPFGAVVLVGRK